MYEDTVESIQKEEKAGDLRMVALELFKANVTAFCNVSKTGADDSLLCSSPVK